MNKIFLLHWCAPVCACAHVYGSRKIVGGLKPQENSTYTQCIECWSKVQTEKSCEKLKIKHFFHWKYYYIILSFLNFKSFYLYKIVNNTIYLRKLYNINLLKIMLLLLIWYIFKTFKVSVMLLQSCIQKRH